MNNLKQYGALKSRVVTAPELWEKDDKPTVFLAGTIDNGEGEQWQQQAIQQLSNAGVTVLNPRRTEWNPNAGDEELVAQINWEMDAMDNADCILFYFAPGSKSPVSMLELGNNGKTNKCIVCCPDGFWRKTNIDVYCNRYGIETRNSLEELISAVKEKFANY